METTETASTDSTITPAPVISVTAGQVIGDRYRIEEPLGWGGMGVVCRATHLALETPVAVKLIRPDFNADSEFVRRFLNEARRAAVLRSERVARVHDVGQLESGEPFLVMEYLEGLELGKYMQQHAPLPPSDALNIALQICEGLAEAHAAGIVHRDIKPGNTFLVRRADGRFAVKILDFGISKQLSSEAATTLTDAGQSLGSPWYMSPEQMLDASRVDHRSDIWSLGVVLFEMLTDHRPFDGATVPEVCAKVLTTPAPSIRYWRPELDTELEAIVAHCLEKHPDDRYPDVAALGAELNDYVARHSGTEARVEPTTFFDNGATEGSIAPIATTRMSTRRRMRLAHALGIVGVLLTIGVAALAFGERTVISAQRGAARLHADLVAARTPAAAPTLAAPARTAPPETPAPPASTTGTAPTPPAASPPPGAAPVVAAVTPPAPAAAAPAEPPTPAEPAATTTARATTPGVAAPPSESSEPRAMVRSRSAERELDANEIEARKERYVRWLAEEGLRRIDEVDDNPFKN